MNDGKLYIVATPIGNLGDVTARALETLRLADFIACEDTRVTQKLLNRFEIKRPTVSYHEHNRRESGERIVARLQNGETCALVTDAGMPAISDPGADLAALCHERGVQVTVIPGASALVCAVAASGLAAQRFCFEGFLSVAKKSRREHLESLKNERRAMVFYEAPHKLTRTLRDMLDALGDRQISVSRELTKIHEETFRTTLSDALEKYAQTPPKGEFVLVVEGAAVSKEEPSDEAAAELALAYIKEGLSVRDASRRASEETGAAKNTIYERVKEIKESGNE